MRKIYTAVFLFFLTISAFAQQPTLDSASVFNPLTNDITEKLPPLEALIDSAINHSARVKYEDFNIKYRECEVTTGRRDWMHYINVGAQFTNGTYWYDDKDELTRLNRFYLTTSKRNQYELGLYVRMPIFYIIDRRNEINKRKNQVEQASSSKEEQIRLVRSSVIEQYMNLVQQQSILRVSSDYQQYTALQMKMAENQFNNGEIEIVELTRQKEIQTRGALEYEQIKVNFKKAYLMLQEVVGIDFNLIFNLK